MSSFEKSSHDSSSMAELLQYKERFHIALKAAKICVFEVDLTKQLYTFFENAEDIFGVTGESILQDVQPFSQLSPSEYQQAASAYFTHPDDSYAVGKAFESILNGNTTTYQARMRTRTTDFVWCKIDVTPIIEDGIPVRMIGVITDISAIKAKTERLEQRIILDSFTGLYNKKSSEQLIKETLCKKADQKHALVLLDLDNFKAINDTCGHAAGDEVLKSISENLKHFFVRRTSSDGSAGMNLSCCSKTSGTWDGFTPSWRAFRKILITHTP